MKKLLLAIILTLSFTSCGTATEKTEAPTTAGRSDLAEKVNDAIEIIGLPWEQAST